MSFMSKEQIMAQRKIVEEQLKILDEQEKNYEKKFDGLKKLEELAEKYKQDKDVICKKYYITDEDIKSLNAPKAIFSFSYSSTFGNKTYEWYKGKIGKAPNEWEEVKAKGVEEVMKYATEFGKKWLESEEGILSFKAYMTPKIKKQKQVYAQQPQYPQQPQF